jgi:hypothetical protein
MAVLKKSVVLGLLGSGKGRVILSFTEDLRDGGDYTAVVTELHEWDEGVLFADPRRGEGFTGVGEYHRA